MQNIVYGEFLPVVLGGGSSISAPTRYDDEADPSALNSFAAAAYRFGHSLIQGEVEMRGTNDEGRVESYRIKDNFFNDSRYVDGDGKGMDR